MYMLSETSENAPRNPEKPKKCLKSILLGFYETLNQTFRRTKGCGGTCELPTSITIQSGDYIKRGFHSAIRNERKPS